MLCMYMFSLILFIISIVSLIIFYIILCTKVHFLFQAFSCGMIYETGGCNLFFNIVLFQIHNRIFSDLVV